MGRATGAINGVQGSDSSTSETTPAMRPAQFRFKLDLMHPFYHFHSIRQHQKNRV